MACGLLLAGSLASAEERQLGTLEWHALLPMSARTQWMVKVGVTVGVACALGMALPTALASMMGSREIRVGVQPFLSAGVGLAVIFLSVMSLTSCHFVPARFRRCCRRRQQGWV